MHSILIAFLLIPKNPTDKVSPFTYTYTNFTNLIHRFLILGFNACICHCLLFSLKVSCYFLRRPQYLLLSSTWMWRCQILWLSEKTWTLINSLLISILSPPKTSEVEELLKFMIANSHKVLPHYFSCNTKFKINTIFFLTRKSYNSFGIYFRKYLLHKAFIRVYLSF